jgi:ATP-dependent helicase/nuclease subunit A
MGKGTLTIYSASAGSGKTYKLTEVYLKSLFRSRYNYRKILAVTFTNKATAEMKSRILDNLHKLATGEHSDYLPELMKSCAKQEEWIRNESKEILNSILHDFSRFSVSTIDSFFQKILRAFAREAGLHAGFDIELDHSMILSKAIDGMIGSALAGTHLNRWLTQYAMSNIDEDKSWNLKEGISRLSQELFREKFRMFSPGEQSDLENKELLLGYIEKIRSLSVTFEKTLLDSGLLAAGIIDRYQVSDDMFYRKSQGIPGFIKSLASGTVKEPNCYVREIEKEPPRWSTGPVEPKLQEALNNGLDAALRDAIHYYDANVTGYRTANAILSNIYALGILSDVLYHVHVTTTEENSFLLSDAGQLLNEITRGDQTPFIYEKVGNTFENFMIDEFQDTSIIQWNNLKPLIGNSMAEGYDNLVVGDVKQSIYRWRNSDWKILGSLLDSMTDNERFLSHPLIVNWRSRSNIISFNNSMFTIIPAQVDRLFEDDPQRASFRKIYSEAIQKDPLRSEGGYVRIEFIENEPEAKWQDKVLGRLPSVVENLQDKGYSASDIAIIVRDGKEGASVLRTFIDYSYCCSEEKRKTYNYNVVSSDSLLLSRAPVISFIISVLSSVNDPADLISKALMLRFYLLAAGDPDAEKVSLIGGKLAETSRNYFPEGYEAFLGSLRQLPLFESVENIISFFGLGKLSHNVAYLNTFQDYMAGFTGSKSGDIRSFLDWWETTGSGKSVVLPGNQNAMRIITIHKSKGLEFKVVILPFLAWNLDHLPSKQPFLWVRPGVAPFDEAAVVPVKYSSELSKTFFNDDYNEERHSAYIDNINLLYVALTRARDVIYGFSVDNPKTENSVACILKNAFSPGPLKEKLTDFDPEVYYDAENHSFEYGEIPSRGIKEGEYDSFLLSEYPVSRAAGSLKLKLHGENYFAAGREEVRKKINYGKLMHEIFEGIETSADIPSAVRKLVLEGKLTEGETQELVQRIGSLINTPEVAEWFAPGNLILTEAGILLPSGNSRRPDRVILREGKTIIIDFKFGEESPQYRKQINLYRELLSEMGYSNIEAFIWYVDNNLIVTA